MCLCMMKRNTCPPFGIKFEYFERCHDQEDHNFSKGVDPKDKIILSALLLKYIYCLQLV